jgi:hypothetical protein
MSLSHDAADAQEPSPPADEPAAVGVRSFRLAGRDAGLKSFRLAPFFSTRRPVSPGAPAEPRPRAAIRSFRLTPLSAEVPSFQLVRTDGDNGEIVLF